MDVSPVSAQPPKGSGTDGLKLNADFSQFLRLLTTQLQNQDPLSPMDTAEFTNQLVQFSGVEQQIKSNSLLENLLSTQTLNMTALGVSFIGKNVEVRGDTFRADGAAPVTMSYALPQAAKTGTVSILDENDNVVYSRNADLSAGLHDLTWDGRDNSGNQVPAGTYHLKVGALTEDNVALNVTTYVPGHVTALESGEDGGLMLNVDGQHVPLTDVRKISEDPAI